MVGTGYFSPVSRCLLSTCYDPGAVLGELPQKLCRLYFAQGTATLPRGETSFF